MGAGKQEEARKKSQRGQDGIRAPAGLCGSQALARGSAGKVKGPSCQPEVPEFSQAIGSQGKKQREDMAVSSGQNTSYDAKHRTGHSRELEAWQR